MQPTNLIYLIMLISINPEQQELFSAFTQANALLLKKYNIKLLHSIAVTVKGQLVNANTIPQPDFINLFMVDSMDVFSTYIQDKDYAGLAQQRADATYSVTAYFAHSLPAFAQDKHHEKEGFYFLGLANFIEANSVGMDDFNQQANEQGLFAKHGMEIDYQLIPFKAVQLIGDAQITTPDRIQLFHTINQTDFKHYVSDPLYQSLAPIRDKTLIKYDFFAGHTAIKQI